jgi:hypothetical protein
MLNHKYCRAHTGLSHEKKKETNEKKKKKALVDPSCPATPTPLEKAPFDLACDFEGCASDTFDEPCAHCKKSVCCSHNDAYGCSASAAPSPVESSEEVKKNDSASAAPSPVESSKEVKKNDSAWSGHTAN